MQTISHQKELTEYRITESQNRYIQHYQKRFEAILSNYMELFFQHIENGYVYHELDSMDFVQQSCLISMDGPYLWPPFQFEKTSGLREIKSGTFSEWIILAEREEFVRQNYYQAVQYYRNASNEAIQRHEKTEALNGLARSLKKQNRDKEARTIYFRILEQYGDITDNTENPYAYYAIHQIIMIIQQVPISDQRNDLFRILDLLLRGNITINANLTMILTEINKTIANFKDNSLQEKLGQIQRWMPFYKEKAQRLREELRRQPYRPDFYIQSIHFNQNKTPFLFIYRNVTDQIYGFEVNLNRLEQDLFSSKPDTDIPFLFHCSIINQDSMESTSQNPFTQIREISARIPNCYIVISLPDLDFLNQYIFRRRMLLGIMLILLTSGMVLGIVIVIRDIRRDKKMVRMRSDFISNVSHELKTPLTTIRMMTDTLRLDRIQSKIKRQEYFEIIIHEIQRLSRLIQNVLDFSRIEQDKKQYFFQKINLSKLVSNVIMTMEPAFKEDQFIVKRYIEPSIVVDGDEDALKQVVLNLISNAIKYSFDQKEIHIQLRQQNHSVCFEVSDKGSGIPESKQPFIFDQFYRAHDGDQRDSGGTGLGLTLVKHIIEAHKGEVTFESKPGQGTRFTICLPEFHESYERESNESEKNSDY